MKTTLRVEFFYDNEAKNWHYRVPALRINGGGAGSRTEAEKESMSAVSVVLQGDRHDNDDQAEAITFDVSVSPAA